MPHAIAACVQCAEVRYRTRVEVEPGYRTKIEDFDPVGNAPPPADPPACHACGGSLKFALDNGQFAPKREHFVRGDVADGRGAPKDTAGPLEGMRVLFAASQGEEVREVREYPGDRFLVVTSRRILMVDVGAFLGEV